MLFMKLYFCLSTQCFVKAGCTHSMYIESDSNVFDGGTISYLLKIQQLLQMYFSKFINNKQAQNLCIAAHFKLWHVVFKHRQ